MLPDAYGCAVANRFGNLLDDDTDPFDLINEVESEKTKKKKKKKEEEEKKAKQKKPGQKESQKDRRLPMALDVQEPVPGKYCDTAQIQTILAAAGVSRRGSPAKSGQFA